MNGHPNQREQHVQMNGGRTENQKEARFDDLKHGYSKNLERLGDVLIHHF